MRGTLVVSIGGNIDGVPMVPEKWDAFKGTLRSLLADVSGYTVFAGHGDGVWEGKFEESYTIIMAEVRYRDVVRLKEPLASLGVLYGQECIALTFGYTTLVRKEV